MPNRRQFLKATGYTLAGMASLPELLAAEDPPRPQSAIQEDVADRHTISHRVRKSPR